MFVKLLYFIILYLIILSRGASLLILFQDNNFKETSAGFTIVDYVSTSISSHLILFYFILSHYCFKF